MLTSSVSLPLEMLYSAANIVRLENRETEGLRVQTVAAERKTVRTQAGLTLLADCSCSKADDADLILLPTFWRNPLRGVRRAAKLQPWLRDAAEAGSQICTVSTGSFLLAESGLLHERAATTHWFYLDAFERRYPTVKTQRHHLITRSDNLFCAGSLNAIADLMIYFIGDHFGEHVGRQVESQFSPEIRRTYRESLYIEGEAELHHDELVAVVQDQLRQRSNQRVSIEAIAEQFRVSPRTLNRRFKDITGLSPLHYLQQYRVNNARDLLLKTDLPVADIATAVGYDDASYFSSLFKREMQVSPKAYRQSVRGKLFTAA